MSLPTHFTLNNGKKIPSVGLGTWQSPPGQVRDAVEAAIRAGYRHIDCAWGYQNEHEVGEGIKASGVPREEIFVTSKLFEFHHNPEHVRKAINHSLSRFGLEYLDLYLMHWPVALEPEVKGDDLPLAPKKKANGKPQVNKDLSDNVLPTWREMEKLVDEGLVKSIGISNFNIRRTRALLKECRIKPVTDQVELSFTCPQPDLIAWLKKNDIVPQAYSPLGSTGASHASLKEIDTLAKKHGVEGANILISWQVARGCNPLPKSVTASRIANNAKLVNLTKEEVDELEKAALSQQKKRVCDQSDDFDYDIFEENHPENNDAAQAKLG
ncbi:putative aldehyde reductase i [Jaminaea rosea]|uniref:Putative aldehyde reductase i n=1 Tax=Jaminaea rosea TaxID=1569628 RepID=A0A316V0D1_9BASI|nr:putative aldehyde reductase i [Jaminaea rosea]PWN30694.1 putative aldehyde reductase i [Jaminaea rosea]